MCRLRPWRQRHRSGSTSLIAQLDVPVGEINEVPPALVLLRCKRDMDKRTPLRPLRSADQRHARFMRESVSFARITRDTGTDNVFPSR